MKTAIFIDGGYLAKIIAHYFPGERVDFSLLSHELSQGKEILRTYYYNCLPYQGSPPTQEEKDRFSKAQRFFRALERLPRYQVCLGTLAFRNNEYEQKGVDTLLSIDMVSLAASGKISDAVLVAGDSDFIPAVRVAKDYGVNVWLYHYNKRGEYHDALWQICDERFPIDDVLVAKVRMPPKNKG